MIADPVAILRDLLLTDGEFAGRGLSPEKIERLVGYYALVMKWNRTVNLTTITQPEEFIQRHLIESLLVAEHLLPFVHEAWDLGSGLGIPGIPVAVSKPSLQVKLVEVNRKKAVFLEEVVITQKLKNVCVENRRIESLRCPIDQIALMARAVDKMSEIMPHIFALGKNAAQILILGTQELAKMYETEFVREFDLTFIEIPGSLTSLLIKAKRST